MCETVMILSGYVRFHTASAEPSLSQHVLTLGNLTSEIGKFLQLDGMVLLLNAEITLNEIFAKQCVK